MKLRGRNILSVIAVLSVAVCLFLSAGRELKVHAEPSTSVNLFTPDGLSSVVLDETNSYLVNNEAASSGVLGENGCTAYFDSTSGILKFNGYDFGAVQVYSDVTIDLYGDNKITNSGRDTAIYSHSGGIIKIQSENAGSLEINNTLNRNDATSYGIFSGGDAGTVIICGDAQVSINIDNGTPYGIFANEKIEILDSACYYANINGITAGYGLYVYDGAITIDTSGDIDIYTYPGKPVQNSYSGTNNLKKVRRMNLRYRYYGGPNCVEATPAWTYEADSFSTTESIEGGNENGVEGVKTSTYMYGNPPAIYIMTGSYYDEQEIVSSKILCLEGEEVTITAPDIYGLGFDFKEWVLLSDVEFVDNTDVKSNPAKVKVGTSDIYLRATYKVFSKEPSFVLTGETVGEGNYPVGKIDFTYADSSNMWWLSIVSETGYVEGLGGPECTVMAFNIDPDKKNTAYDLADDYNLRYLEPGVYRLAVKDRIKYDTWFYSEPFTVSYSKPIKDIEIATAPAKTTYTAGEGFDPAGTEIKVNYSDESYAILNEGFKWSPDNALANGDDKVTISYTLCGKTYTVDLGVTVNPSYDVLESIAVATSPNKTNYIEGQSFDASGMIVIASYEGEVSKEITGYTITPSGALTLDDSVITITYILNGKTCTTTQEITVEPRYLESITIDTPPIKTVYEIDDYFDKTGMVVIANWNDGTSEAITGYVWFPKHISSTSYSEITVYYEDQTAKLPITIKTLESISITTSPDKTVYTHLESFDKTGMVVTAKYSDNSTADIKDYVIIPDGGLKTTDTSITISYTEKGITKTAIQAITVNERDDLEKIKILKDPDKMAYVAGEIFAPVGMIVEAVYNNASARISYGFDNINGPLTFSPSGALSADDTIITITYTEGGITKTVTQEITVTAANSGNSGSGNNNSGNNSGSNSGNTNTGSNTGNNSGSNSGNSGSGSTYIPVSTPTPTPEVPGTTTKEVKNADGSKTTTTRTLEESGKVTETTVKESKNGDKSTTEVVTDGSGKIVSTIIETKTTNKSGTTTVSTTEKKADGSLSYSTVETYKSGKVVSKITETNADKSRKTVEETKQADGSTTKTVTKVSAGGSAKMTVTAETPAADDKEAKKTEFVYSMTESGKAKLVKVTTDEAEITIPAAITINGVKCKVVTIGKSAFKGNTSITKIVIGKYVETIGTKAFAGLKDLNEISISSSKLSKVSKSAFYKISKDAKFYIKAKKSACKAIAALITKSGVKKVYYERVK